MCANSFFPRVPSFASMGPSVFLCHDVHTSWGYVCKSNFMSKPITSISSLSLYINIYIYKEATVVDRF